MMSMMTVRMYSRVSFFWLLATILNNSAASWTDEIGFATEIKPKDCIWTHLDSLGVDQILAVSLVALVSLDEGALRPTHVSSPASETHFNSLKFATTYAPALLVTAPVNLLLAELLSRVQHIGSPCHTQDEPTCTTRPKISLE
jgi:hypothetical protein